MISMNKLSEPQKEIKKRNWIFFGEGPEKDLPTYFKGPWRWFPCACLEIFDNCPMTLPQFNIFDGPTRTLRNMATRVPGCRFFEFDFLSLDYDRWLVFVPIYYRHKVGLKPQIPRDTPFPEFIKIPLLLPSDSAFFPRFWPIFRRLVSDFKNWLRPILNFETNSAAAKWKRNLQIVTGVLWRSPIKTRKHFQSIF